MTTVAETRTTDRRTAAAEKRQRMLAAGYTVAQKPTRCALCGGRVAPGMYLAKMPASWNINNPRRWAHRACHEKLLEWVRARAAGQAVAPLTWEPRNAAWTPAARRPVTPASNYQIRRAASTRSIAQKHIDTDGLAAAEYVARVVADTGTGPTWRELGSALGWPERPWSVVSMIVRGLARQGWLSFGDGVERSLRPGPAAGGTTRG